MAKITVTGQIGAGKTTFCKLLKEKTDYERMRMGKIFRRMAGDTPIEEFYENLKNDPDAEKKIDDEQRSYGEKNDNFIMDGRISYLFIPDSIKVFLTVDPMEGARRVYLEKQGDTERKEAKVSSIEDQLRMHEERAATERERYKSLYGIDHHDLKNFDCVIDTTSLTPEEVVEEFLKKYPNL